MWAQAAAPWGLLLAVCGAIFVLRCGGTTCCWLCRPARILVLQPTSQPPTPTHLPRLACVDSQRVQAALRPKVSGRRQLKCVLPLAVIHQPDLLEAPQGGQRAHVRQWQEGAFQLQAAEQGEAQDGGQGALRKVLRRQAQAAKATQLRAGAAERAGVVNTKG